MRWFLEEDDGEAESVKSEMMVASSVLCDLTPHCFAICDRRDRGVDSVLYTVHVSKHRRKRRDVAFIYCFNQTIRELWFHLFGFGNTVHNGSCSHTNMSPCTLDAGGSAPQLTSKETRRKRGTQDNRAGVRWLWAALGQPNRP